MILAGDVGGTKVHLGLFSVSQPVTLLHEKKYKSRDYPEFRLILKDFLAQFPDASIKKACLGVAGPIRNGRCQATNLPWVIDAQQLAKGTKIPQVWLINDLEANAWGMRFLKPEEMYTLNVGEPIEGNQALIAAGTGLGEAGLYWNGICHLPFACEGGHTNFGPRNEEEMDLWRYLYGKFSHVSYERILSGPGLFDLYQFLVETNREKRNPLICSDDEPQKKIGEFAVERSCPTCIRAVELFVSIYGSEAGNLALKMLSVNGVFLGGGIAPKLLPIFQSGEFMNSFIDKGRFNSLLSKIPVHVVLNEHTALWGAAQYAIEKK